MKRRRRMRMMMVLPAVSVEALPGAQHWSMHSPGANAFNPLWLPFFTPPIILDNIRMNPGILRKLIWGYVSLALRGCIYGIHSHRFHPGTGMAPRTAGVIMHRGRARDHIVLRTNPAMDTWQWKRGVSGRDTEDRHSKNSSQPLMTWGGWSGWIIYRFLPCTTETR